MKTSSDQSCLSHRRKFLCTAAALCGPSIGGNTAAFAVTSHMATPRAAIAHANEFLMDKFIPGRGGRFQVRVDPTFSDSQKDLIRRAMDFHFRARSKMIERIATSAVHAAQYDLPKSDATPKRTQRKLSKKEATVAVTTTLWQWRALDPGMSPVALSTPGQSGRETWTHLHIARFWSDPDTVGRGWFGITKGERPLVGGYRFCISLNSDYMNERHTVVPSYWAGVIMHECLHNLGYTHPDISAEAYNRHFINVFERAYVGRDSVDDKADALDGGGRMPALTRCHD